MRIIRVMQDWEDEAYDDLTSADPTRKSHPTRHVRTPADIRQQLIGVVARERRITRAEAEPHVPNPRAMRQICTNMKQNGDLEKVDEDPRKSGWVLPEHLYRRAVDETVSTGVSDETLDETLTMMMPPGEPIAYDTAVAVLVDQHAVDDKRARIAITRALRDQRITTDNEMELLWKIP